MSQHSVSRGAVTEQQNPLCWSFVVPGRTSRAAGGWVLFSCCFSMVAGLPLAAQECAYGTTYTGTGTLAPVLRVRSYVRHAEGTSESSPAARMPLTLLQVGSVHTYSKGYNSGSRDRVVRSCVEFFFATFLFSLEPGASRLTQRVESGRSAIRNAASAI